MERKLGNWLRFKPENGGITGDIPVFCTVGWWFVGVNVTRSTVDITGDTPVSSIVGIHLAEWCGSVP